MQYPCQVAESRRWFLMHVAPVVHPGGGAVVSHLDVSAWVLPQAIAPGAEA